MCIFCCYFSIVLTGGQNAVFSLIVLMSEHGPCPDNESTGIRAKNEKVTNPCLMLQERTQCQYTDAVATYETHKQLHLKTALAFYTTVCMAGLHRDCMPFKKGQINIALLPHKNTAVVLGFFSCTIHKST